MIQITFMFEQLFLNSGCEPPRKKARRLQASSDDMQQPASNGVIENGASCSSNGHCGDVENGVTLSNSSQEIVRIIGQYLSSEGLK
ncbi:hypothetical protein HUJ05_000827 [Dendroctonus ponderosae]|nr:hypothetical protein HUJ05_000827 [Dendroctonus ponderosae]